MATLSFSCSSPSLNYQPQTFLSHPSHLPYALSYSCNLLEGPKKNGNPYISSCNNPVPRTKKGVQVKGECVTKRRELLLHAGSVAFSLSAFSSIALAENDVAEDFRVYSDDVNKFKIMIPRDWQIGAGEGDGVRSLIAFYPQEASNTNVSIVITSLGADFTKLESFGKVDAFAENLVSGLDRSWQRPAGVKAKLIDSKASKGLYYIEYTLQNPGESLRHLFSVLGIADNGVYNRLYTLTGQFVDEEAEKYGAQVEKAVSSFRLI
ncbi:psbP domain-containing protein 3, chloroplastic [Nicotiana tabacum]|uniref:PsbP domain-containing protein 3, chloroplastic n=2 Tax=Nicotiana TaxID=4085 RepID=A0A1S4A2H7_TOBAC|nr:PREDICTED: psbP domain-containing protein 3, chloroplastic [Nicotiana sylvestris]XP_016470833.1 PREDICTED: psbP domain-containing protein 3, chloroplastic-like [Nicotiana tabacum]